MKNSVQAKNDKSPVAGLSLVFSMRHPDKQDGEIKNQLQPHPIRQRISVSSLNPRRIFFVETNNLHCMPSHCTGVLVAYSHHKGRLKDEDITKSQWFLGTMLFHSYKKTVISPTEIPVKYYQQTNHCTEYEQIRYDMKVGHNAIFEHGEVKVRYLNVVNVARAQYPFLHASLLGPDTTTITMDMRKVVKENVNTVQSLYPDGITSIPNRYVHKSHLLDILNACKDGQIIGTKTKKVKRKTMSQTGTHVVEIEGPSLKLHDGTDENCLLVPLIENLEKKVHTRAYIQRYIYVPKEKYLSLISEKPRNITEFNNRLCMASQKSIDLLKFDLKQYPQGLMFVFKKSNTFEKPTIVREYDSKEPVEHWQVKGTVMSHWVVSEKTYTISREHVNIMENVYGHRGFNRSSVGSIGINIYTGIKSSPRVIPNPL